MDVSNELHVRIKTMGVVYTLIAKPTRTLAPDCCIDVGPILRGLFSITLDSWESNKNYPQDKI